MVLSSSRKMLKDHNFASVCGVAALTEKLRRGKWHLTRPAFPRASITTSSWLRANNLPTVGIFPNESAVGSGMIREFAYWDE